MAAPARRRLGIAVGVVIVGVVVAVVGLRWWAGTGELPRWIERSGDRLADLPACEEDNCVSSAAGTRPDRTVEPLACSFDEATVAVADLHRVSRVEQGLVPEDVRAEDGAARFLHVEASTRWFGFVDDVVLLGPDEGPIDVWSGSRLGSDDFGVNAQRVADIRSSCAGGG